MKKIFLTMACLCVVLFVFSACAAESGDSGSDSKSSESDQTVYYTLTLNANGGEGSTVYNNIKANQKFVLENARALGVTRKNYSFVGWARTSYAENASYEDGGTVVVNSNITLYAVWKKNSGTKTDTNKEDDTPKKVTYTVMFDSNGGTSIAPKTVNSGDRVSEPDAPVKIGNTFAGWYSDSDFYTKYNFRNVVGDNITLYAKWNLIEYSIEYELNGGEWEADYNVSESFTVEECFVLPDAEKLSKTGFGFTGWHEKSDLSDSAILQIQKGTTENKKYYASWEEGVVNYTVRHFKQNISKDGYEEVYDDAQVLTGKTNSQTEATSLSYEGFTPEEFSQVEIKADGTSEVSIYYSRNSYTVTFDTNGGSEIPAKTVVYGDSAGDYLIPEKKGYYLEGWYSDPNFCTPYFFFEKVTDNITIYTKWGEGTANYTVRHFKQNLSRTGYDEEVYSKQLLMGKTNSQTEAAAFSYEGFTPEEFSQVEINGDGTTEVCIYYKRNSYTVTFDTNGGSEIPAKTVVYGDSAGDYLIPEKKGYYLEGWYSDPNFCTPYFFFEKVTDNITIYTKWGEGTANYTVRHFKQNLSRTGYDEEVYSKQLLMGKTNSQTEAAAFSYEGFTPEEFSQVEINADGTTEVCIYYSRNSYTVTFDTNGGSEITQKYAVYGDSVTEPDIPKKSGYTFGGWYLDSDFYKEYDFGEAITDNIVLYARWELVEYSIEYELNGGRWNSDATVQNSFTVEDSFVLPDAEKLSKQGYGFTGWHEREGLSDDAILQIAKGTTGNKKYYASWGAGVVNYTVRHFKQNVRRDGYDEVTDDAQVLTGKTNTQTSATALSYEGFTPYEVSQETIKADGTSVVNIYYIRNSYTVTFETNGGSEIADRTIIYGETLYEPAAPTKEGCVFNGWYASSNFSSLYTFGNTISDNITLYAKWQNTAGIAVSVSPNSTVSITKTETNDSITLTATSGHSSYNWKIDDSAASSFDGANVNGNTLTISKAKLVAGYRYQISLYAPKGGIPYSAQIAVIKGE